MVKRKMSAVKGCWEEIREKHQAYSVIVKPDVTQTALNTYIRRLSNDQEAALDQAEDYLDRVNTVPEDDGAAEAAEHGCKIA